MPEFVEKATVFLVERVAPVLGGRRSRHGGLRLEDLKRQSNEELESRINLGRPQPDEWPAAPPALPVTAAPEVRLAPELQVLAVRMEVPAPRSRPRTRPEVLPTRRR